MSYYKPYTASDGSKWLIYNECPPIPTRSCDWAWVHDDYDGAPDAFDDRHGNAPTKKAAIDAIEDWVGVNA